MATPDAEHRAGWSGRADDAAAQAWQRARRRVRKLRGFYIHATVYGLVMTGLVITNLLASHGRIWFPFPLLGWGAGLTIHGLAVWQGGRWFGPDWEARKIAEILAREQIRTLSTEKQLAEARLRLLQAQIEPHFLFNTLANVLSLIDSAPQRASLMLEHFIDYLRSSLAASRSTRGTVDQEIRLLRNYLTLLTIRMGERLRYTIDVEPGLDEAPLAPMLLQPVVENAIRHGLEPRVDGGEIAIRIYRVLAGDGPRMIIRISDNGLGFRPSAQSGVGLGNLRERLAVLYDGQARLTIESPQQGTVVQFDLPMPVGVAAGSPAAGSPAAGSPGDRP